MSIRKIIDGKRNNKNLRKRETQEQLTLSRYTLLDLFITSLTLFLSYIYTESYLGLHKFRW